MEEEEVQEILFDTGRSAMTDKASEEDYDYPRFLPPSHRA
jgi:hypothetical protein